MDMGTAIGGSILLSDLIGTGINAIGGTFVISQATGTVGRLVTTEWFTVRQ